MDDPILLELRRYESQMIKRDSLEEVMEPEDLPKEVRELLEQYHPSRSLPKIKRGEMLDILQRLTNPGFMIRASLPLTCVGEGTDEIEPCPYVPGCPLVSAGIPPLGKTCPFEQKTVDELFTQYMRNLEVDSINLVEMSQVKDLVIIDLLMQRITGTLSRSGLIDINPIGAFGGPGPKGTGGDIEVLYRKDTSAVADLLDKMVLRKNSILKSLMATREMKAKYNKAKPTDTAALIAKLRKAQSAQVEDAE